MIFWRIGNHVNLNGRGGLRAEGRWHLCGFPVVYLAESPAAAMLEVGVHTSAGDLPPTMKLMRILGPDLAFEEIDPESLTRGWRTDHRLTQQLGTAWLESGRTALLRIPCTHLPETCNYLLNPLHPRADLFRVERRYDFPVGAVLRRA